MVAALATTIGNRVTSRLVEAAPTASDAAPVQRDLVAYNEEKAEMLPSVGPMGGPSSMITTSAEAPGVRAALADLIKQGKVKEVRSASGKQSWFAANHSSGVGEAEIAGAFAAAGYAKATAMARALFDKHGESLYSNRKLTTFTMFGARERDLGDSVATQTDRSLTEYEISEARKVFKGQLDYGKVLIMDGSIKGGIISVGGYARTVGNSIAFPAGASRNMGLMIHELTHVWQYQTIGASYAPRAIWAQVTEGYSYTDSGKSAEQSLIDARAAGKTLYSYNLEQQGDILADYWRRLRDGQDPAAWQPFVDDIQPSRPTPPTPAPTPTPAPGQPASTACVATGNRVLLTKGGHAGPEVEELACLLDKASEPLLPLKVDNIYGIRTRSAVVAFQAARGLTRSGSLDGPTWAALEQETGPSPTKPTLTRGDRGPQVGDLQQRLNTVGEEVTPVDVTQVFNDEIEAAVVGFQDARHLKVDGKVGEQTWASLDATPASTGSAVP